MIWQTSKWFLFPSPARSKRKISSNICYEVVPLWLGSPGVFISQTCANWASSTLFLIVQVFLSQPWFLWKFSLESLYCGNPWLPVFTCLSLQSWGQQLFLYPSLLLQIWRVIDISVYLVFYLLWGQRGHFQASYWQIGNQNSFIFIFIGLITGFL